jgi:hypothetical protein
VFETDLVRKLDVQMSRVAKQLCFCRQIKYGGTIDLNRCSLFERNSLEKVQNVIFLRSYVLVSVIHGIPYSYVSSGKLKDEIFALKTHVFHRFVLKMIVQLNTSYFSWDVAISV